MTLATTELDGLLARSRELILAAQRPSGAYPASEAFPAYRGYCWLRDGAFIADAMSSAGEADSAGAFFDWCAGAVAARRDRIGRIVAAARAGRPLPDGDMLPTRFRFDGSDGDDDWWDFQLDGYGTWLWAVVAHARRHALDLTPWAEALRLTVDYLVSSWSRPCFDWWEEHDEHVHVSTLGCVAAGLRAAIDSGALDPDRVSSAAEAGRGARDLLAARGVRDGHLVKWLDGEALDGSLAALVAPLGVLDPSSPVATATVGAIESELLADGGVYRFRADTFYGGGRWPLLTCFLGLARHALGDRDGALACLDWAAGSATPRGDLPEQVDGGLLLAPARRQEWLDRWGSVATPLLWSHAMVLRLAADLGLGDGGAR